MGCGCGGGSQVRAAGGGSTVVVQAPAPGGGPGADGYTWNGPVRATVDAQPVPATAANE